MQKVEGRKHDRNDWNLVKQSAFGCRQAWISTVVSTHTYQDLPKSGGLQHCRLVKAIRAKWGVIFNVCIVFSLHIKVIQIHKIQLKYVLSLFNIFSTM